MKSHHERPPPPVVGNPLDILRVHLAQNPQASLLDESTLTLLSFVYDKSILNGAIAILDQGALTRHVSPNGRSMYFVRSDYICGDKVEFCTCQSFCHSKSRFCKHILAVQLANANPAESGNFYKTTHYDTEEQFAAAILQNRSFATN